jgi:hypothetical protein
MIPFTCCDTSLRPIPSTHLDGCAFAFPFIGAHRAPGPAATTDGDWETYVPTHRGPRLAMQVV